MPNSPDRPLLALAFALSLALSACRSQPEVPELLMDGRFDEWEAVPARVIDPVDAPGSIVDFGEIKSLDDPRFLYLSLEVGGTVNAQAAPGTFHISFDADGDVSTGAERHGLPGTDFVLTLSRRPGGVPYGQGMEVVEVGTPTDAEPSSANALGVLVSPTHSANRLEARIARASRTPSGGPWLTGDSARVRITFADARGSGDQVEPFTHRFASPAVYGPRIRWNQFLDSRDGTYRVVQWNVAESRFRQNPAAFARVLGALNPDVVLLDEVYGDISEGALNDFFGMADLGESGPWAFAIGSGGGRQKSVVASRLPLRPESTMARLDYAPDSLEALAEETPVDRFIEFLEIERERGLSAVGAWVTVAEDEVLFVAADLQSRGADGTPEDRLREVQASAIRDAAMRAADGRPVVIGGDFNLVGSSRPLERLSRRTDGDLDSQPVPARRFLDQSFATWRSSRAVDFTPGRLDFILVPTSVFEVDRAYVFDAADLTDNLRESLGVMPDDNRSSDHLPVVADLRPRTH